MELRNAALPRDHHEVWPAKGAPLGAVIVVATSSSTSLDLWKGASPESDSLDGWQESALVVGNLRWTSTSLEPLLS